MPSVVNNTLVIDGGQVEANNTFQEWLDATNDIIDAFDNVVYKDNSGNVTIDNNLEVANTVTVDNIEPTSAGGTVTIAGDIAMDDTLTIDSNGVGQVAFQLASVDTWKFRTNAAHTELQFFDGVDTFELNSTTKRIDSATYKISGNILTGGTGVTYTESTGTFSIGQDVSTTANVEFNSVTVTDELDVSAASTITLPVGFGLVPTGAILMWSGSIVSIPSGWALCDGTNGTPNLQNRFIVGAGDNYAVDATGGADSVALTTAQMPAHTHGAGTIATSSAGAHTHTYSDSYILGGGSFLDTGDGGTDRQQNTQTLTTNSAGEHTHTITGNTGSTGSDAAHENRPPYYALAYIMKT